MDYKKQLGAWVNTFPKGHTIARFSLFEENGVLMMETETATEPIHWGKTTAFPFGTEKDPAKLAAFEARYERDAFDAHLCVNESKGLLIVSAFHYMKPGSGKNSFFTREFFHKD